MHAIQELIKEHRQRLRDVRKAYRDRLAAADQVVRTFTRESNLIIEAFRLVNGLIQPARKRNMAKVKSFEPEGPYTAELHELITRAQAGDATAMPELKILLDDTPDLWQQIGDLAAHVETAWIKLLANTDLFTQECLLRQAARRREELLGDNPTPIERHLAERIVATWLQVQHAEVQMGRSEGASEQQLNFLHKRLESAQKQHLAAIDQLVKVREAAKTKIPRASKRQRQHKSAAGPTRRERRPRVAGSSSKA